MQGVMSAFDPKRTLTVLKSRSAPVSCRWVGWCLLLAQSGHDSRVARCPLSGV